MAIPLGPGDKAHMYALGGVMRGGVGRAGYVDGRVYIQYDGDQIGFARDDADVGVLLNTLTIRDILDETPNTCEFRVNGAALPTPAPVTITIGSKNRIDRLFAGYALTADQRYAAQRPAYVQADVTCVDYTWLLAFTKVTKQYISQSASTIIRDLVATFAGANGFTAGGVVDGLATLDEITFTDEDLPTAITRTVRRAGAYWYCDYHQDVHAFVDEATDGAPVALTPSHKSLANFVRHTDRTQVLSRVYVEGRGSRIAASVNPGDDRIPVTTVDMFTPAVDVFLKASFQGADGGAQHLNFAGVDAGGGGTLVGPGSSPGTGPTLALITGGGAVDVGAHSYAYSWVTASGETRPSAATAIATAGALAAPTLIPQLAYIDDPCPPYGANCWKPGDTVEFAYSYSLDPVFPPESQGTPLSPIHGPVTCVVSPYHWSGTTPGTNAKGFQIWIYHSPDPKVKVINIWHRINGGAGQPAGKWWLWASGFSIANHPEWTSQVVQVSGPHTWAQGAYTPPTVAPSFRTVRVDGVAVGPSGVTARKLYRTKSGLASLQLLATLADNVTTSYTDGAADTALGAPPPSGDTSGLQQPVGQIAPGSTSIIVASSAPFRSDGGWAVLGNGDQVVRYTGVSGGALIGIPPTGPGSLAAVVVYNTTITASPMLTGIPATGDRSIRRALTDGDEIYLVVFVEDLGRQSTLAAALGVPNGAREDWIQDRRLSIAEARARGRATLALRPLDQFGVTYTVRDLRTASGKTIHVDLPAPTNVVGDFKIQAVTIQNFRPYGAHYPTYTVDASSSRFSFEDWLNRVRTKE